MGKSSKAKYFLPGVAPLACPPERLIGFFTCGAQVEDVRPPIGAGFALGHHVRDNAQTIATGFKLGTKVKPRPDLAKPGFKFAMNVLKKPDVAREGFDMGLRVREKPLPSMISYPGFDMGIRVKDRPLPGQLLKPAFKMGLVVGDSHPPYEITDPAFAFGLVVGDSTPPYETIDPAFRLGMTVTPDDAPPPDRRTCPGAVMLTPPDGYILLSGTTGDFWFIFDYAVFTVYHMTFTLLSGSVSLVRGYKGTSCSSLEELWFHSSGTFTQDFPSLSSTGGHGWIKIEADGDTPYQASITWGGGGSD